MPAARGHKVLPGFYAFIKPVLQAQGCRQLVCWIDSANQASIRSHSNVGFRRIGTIYEIRVGGCNFNFLSQATRARLRTAESK